jgi:hypothetical protein
VLWRASVSRWLVEATFLGFCLVSIFSIGFFFLPAALLSVMAAAVARQDSRQPA